MSIIKKKINLSINGFYLRGNQIYQWNPTLNEFNSGSGWNNTGLTVDLHYYHSDRFDCWFNATNYRLNRPSDAYPFMKDKQGIPLANTYRPLESPQSLVKLGASYQIETSKTTISSEMIHNGKIKGLYPARSNADELFYLHTIPSSQSINFIVRQDLTVLNLTNWFLTFRVENLFNSKVLGILPSEAEGSWSESVYEKPHQLPSFGRMFHVRLQAVIK